MKKDIHIENILYINNKIKITRINGLLNLYYLDEFITNEIFEIVLYGIVNKITDIDFWSIQISKLDKNSSKSINLIYFYTGHDKIWKNNNWIWKKEWNELASMFLEFFETRINKFLFNTNNLKDLKKKIKYISYSDFYEFGLKYDLINSGDGLL